MRSAVVLWTLLVLGLPMRVEGDPGPEDEARSEIVALLEAQVVAWNEGDIEGFMRAYDPSEELLFASGDQVTRGWRTTLERYQNRYGSRAEMGRLAFELLQVDLLGEAHAKVLGRWRLVREEDSPHGLFTLILARGEGTWRIIHDHTSSASE